MKKIILTILTTITILGVNAQGNNLQFNRAFNYEYSQLCSLQDQLYSAGSITVPQNKVWKITHSSVYNSTHISHSGSLLIDNILVSRGRISNGTTDGIDGIIWLNSGNYTVYLVSTSTSNSITNIKSTISGIEFNIVQ